MEISNKDFRAGNYIHNLRGQVAVIELINIEHGRDRDYRAWLVDTPAFGCEIIKLIDLTKEWARDLGFEIIDMGDFWEFNKDDFQLIQMKVPLTDKVLDPVFIIHSKKSKHIRVRHVHKLQNLYYEIEGKELTLKKKTSK